MFKIGFVNFLLFPFFTKEKDTEAIYNALLDAHPNLSVYKKADIPDRLHYKNHRRIAPILVVADEHWHIMIGNNTSCK